MSSSLVFADFQNADSQGRLRLNCAGTLEDLSKLGLRLSEGLQLSLSSPDGEDGESELLVLDGLVEFSQAENCWVAVVDWNNLRRVRSKNCNGHSSSQNKETVAVNLT